MIRFTRFCLNNGLKVLVHEDRSTPLAAMNLLYDVGSRDEDPESTGLAHLFEHLMFGGTTTIPEFDKHIQLAGGENNAFTNNDITNFYITIPAENIETAFWLESDRMSDLDLTVQKLEIQKNVVIEEFNQRYLNQPYGDVMLLLRPLAYKVHPYRWPTIGMDTSHIRNTGLAGVKDFFSAHYAPDNAILCITGNISPDRVRKLAEKWFGRIDRRKTKSRNLPPEPVQNEARKVIAEREVPVSAIYKAWHTGPRNGPDFYALDLITDLLAGGESGRLFDRLVRKKKLFSEINAYITSDNDPGLAIIHGKLMKGVEFDQAEESINHVIKDLQKNFTSPSELKKVKNRHEASVVLGNCDILNKALKLSLFELLGDSEMINYENELYTKTDKEKILSTASRYFTPENCSTLHYKSIIADK